jgi:hypothetical protein
MEPLLIETVRELNCLSNLTKNGTWTGNLNYWTGGTQRDCRGSWSWCGKDGARVFNDDITWDKNQPDNKGGREDCIHLRLKKNNVTGRPEEFVLTDRNCTDKYVLACKVLRKMYMLVKLLIFGRCRATHHVQRFAHP